MWCCLIPCHLITASFDGAIVAFLRWSMECTSIHRPSTQEGLLCAMSIASPCVGRIGVQLKQPGLDITKMLLPNYHVYSQVWLLHTVVVLTLMTTLLQSFQPQRHWCIKILLSWPRNCIHHCAGEGGHPWRFSPTAAAVHEILSPSLAPDWKPTYTSSHNTTYTHTYINTYIDTYRLTLHYISLHYITYIHTQLVKGGDHSDHKKALETDIWPIDLAVAGRCAWIPDNNTIK